MGEAGSPQQSRGRRHPLPPELGSFCGRMRADGQLCGRLVGGLCSQIPGDGIDASWCVLDGPCPAGSTRLQTGSRVEDSAVFFSLFFLKK